MVYHWFRATSAFHLSAKCKLDQTTFPWFHAKFHQDHWIYSLKKSNWAIYNADLGVPLNMCTVTPSQASVISTYLHMCSDFLHYTHRLTQYAMYYIIADSFWVEIRAPPSTFPSCSSSTSMRVHWVETWETAPFFRCGCQLNSTVLIDKSSEFIVTLWFQVWQIRHHGACR